ncbi:hypothetical protein [Streptacidiphilus sp. EB129]|jgi:hypothetical protein|uniref:hypothetical protein n=1 Tax=Streptacidiphilus sp. EB129 TaxID=3156262 RepID=UPI0035184A8D
MAATDPDDFQQRLAALPARITRKQIAQLANVSPETVVKWVADTQRRPKFPAPLAGSGREKEAKEYSRARVGTWLHDYFAKESARKGPRRRTGLGRLGEVSPSDSRRMTDRELAQLRGVTTEGITDYQRRYGKRAHDPFPPRDETGTRSVADVAAWFARHTPGPRGPRPADVISIPGTTPQMSDTQRATVLRTAFAVLPDRCTTADIVTVTGAAKLTVAGWARRKTFPAPLVPGTFQPGAGQIAAQYPSRDVAAWCLDYLFGEAKAAGTT